MLPYSKDRFGRVWFLLGREKPNVNWANDSSSWSEFGGSLDGNETPEEGAAREFFEETMGAVFGRKDWMENELRNGRYLFAMDSRTPSGKGYRSFVKYIPFVDYPKKFARYRTMSKKQPNLFAHVSAECFQLDDGGDGKIHPSCTEKTSIAWFSADCMARAVQKYKHARASASTAVPNAKLSAYCEPDGIPHIRTGFAIDFDHVLNTSWAKAGFINDEHHFPLLPNWGASPPLSASSETGRTPSPPNMTPASANRPILKTPRYLMMNNVTEQRRPFQMSSGVPVTPHVPSAIFRQHDGPPSSKKKDERRPPTLMVNLNGYTFVKKRKKKRNKKKRLATATTPVTTETATAEQLKKYKPKLPIF